MDTLKINKKNVLMVEHRGLSGIETENTQCAFVAAGNRSYYGIETDVHATKDGKYVISHDENLKRIFGADVNICDCTYEQLRKIRINTDGDTVEYTVVPSLKECLEVCKKYDKICVLELKVNFEEAQLKDIIAEVENAKMSDKIVYISFHAEALKKMRALLPNAILQFLTGEINDDTINYMVEYKLDLDCYYPSLNEENVKILKQKGIKINCWTVNDKTDAEKLVDLGVDFITTNILE